LAVHEEVALPETSSAAVPADANSLANLALILATGWLVTNLALSIADLPLKYLLKERVGLDAAAVAIFFAIGNFTNYIKPIAGVLSDSVPFFGTRRRHYLLLGVGGGGVFWLLLGLVPRTYPSLLITYTLFYITVVLTSTALGGRMVEVGQQHGAAGRLTAQRIATFRIATLVGGVVGGWLALRPFGLTMAISGILHFALFALLCYRLPEPRTARLNTTVGREAAAQFRTLLQSTTLLSAAGMICLIAASPGFGTPLFFYQTNALKFSKPFVGLLTSCSAAFGLIGAWFYFAFCRRLSLRRLLVASIVVHALGTLTYLGYHDAPSALFITALNGIGGTLAMLPVYDLAARATPRGSEAIGYSVMMSVWNLTNALSDTSGSWLYSHFGLTFKHLVWLNAGTTALVLFAIPMLPAVLLRARDGEAATAVIHPDECPSEL
jgi:Na+/melibiose symporter-like transporter